MSGAAPYYPSIPFQSQFTTQSPLSPLEDLQTTQLKSDSYSTQDAPEIRICSVKGCSKPVEPNAGTKMCDVCRSRHRVYANTKRAKRKMEKAAITGQIIKQVAVSVEQVPVWVSPEHSSPTDIATAQVGSTSVESSSPVQKISDPTSERSVSVSDSYHSSTSPPSSAWDHGAIDPRLFASQSSELAGALTLPPQPKLTNQQPQSIPQSPIIETTSFLPDSTRSTTSIEDIRLHTDTKPSTSSDVTTTIASSSSPPRFCSVKGCKALIPGDYFYKMCEPCRDRYRGYGTTKRAKWKRERIAVNAELELLREQEDQRRLDAGLPPLSESLEEWRAWEQSIIDEQVPPLPSEHNPDVQPLPARMCTVSHCHKILPGFYRYKRCEQHRLQNRYHSKLKRVREKVVKAKGPGVEFSNWVPLTLGKDWQDENEANRKEKGKEKEKEKEKEKPLLPPEPLFTHVPIDLERKIDEDGATTKQTAEISKTAMREAMVGVAPSARGIRRATHVCSMKACENMLAPHVPWKMCDTCRAHDRVVRKTKRLKEMEHLDVEEVKADDNSSGDQDKGEGSSASVVTEALSIGVAAINPLAEPTASPPQSLEILPTPSTGISNVDPHTRAISPSGSEGSINEIFTDLLLPAEEKSKETKNEQTTSKLHSNNEQSERASTNIQTTYGMSSFFTRSDATFKPYVHRPEKIEPAKVKETTKRKRDRPKPSNSTSTFIPTAPIIHTPTQTPSTPMHSTVSSSLPNGYPINMPVNPHPAPSAYPMVSHMQHQYHIPYYIPPYSIPPYPMPAMAQPDPSSSSGFNETSLPVGLSYPPHHYPPIHAYSHLPPHPYGYGGQHYPTPYPYVPRYAPPYGVSATTQGPSQSQEQIQNVPITSQSTTKSGTAYRYYTPPSQSTHELPSSKRKRKRVDSAKPSVSGFGVFSAIPDSSLLLPTPSSTDRQIGLSGTSDPSDTSSLADSVGSIPCNPADTEQDSNSAKRVNHPCGNKTCRRIISAETTGILCDRCRSRIRKHQVKTKQRFKLERRKVLPSSEESV